MLRDLGTTRRAENEPTDSVFVVLLVEELPTGAGNAIKSYNVGSVWLTQGEAIGAARRYQNEGHRAHHGWQSILVMEYQTGQLAPKGERHGEELQFQPVGAIGPTDADRIAELELEIAKLRAKHGQSELTALR